MFLLPGGISFLPNVLLEINPEGEYKVNDDGRSHRNEGGVDKIKSDDAGSDAKLFSKERTDTEDSPFNKIFKTIHEAKIMRLKHLWKNESRSEENFLTSTNIWFIFLLRESYVQSHIQGSESLRSTYSLVARVLESQMLT